MNSDFFDVVQLYSGEDGLDSDLTNLRKGGNQCAELQALLAREAVAFQRCIKKNDNFFARFYPKTCYSPTG